MREDHKLPPFRQSLAGVLLAAHDALMAPVRPKLREMNVTEQQWRVLRALDGVGEADPTTLASTTMLLPPSITRILKELVDRRLILRATDPKDRRRSIVTLTPSGEALIREIAHHVLRVHAAYNQRFGRERIGLFVGEARALIEAVRPVTADELPPLMRVGNR